MKRSKHSLSHYKLSTFNMGDLYPCGLMETLPGDTFQHSTSMLLRFLPILAPVMHPVSVRIHHWFVPFRLLYDGWEDFITGGPDGTGSAEPYPTNVAPIVSAKGNLLEAFGVNPGTYPTGSISTLPLRAYNLIYNEFYRDEDLILENSLDSNAKMQIAWEKDYFTTARPWTQKGPDVVVPLGGTAPVVPAGSFIPQFRGVVSGPAAAGPLEAATTANPTSVEHETGGSAHVAGESLRWDLPELEADLTGASAASIIQFRQAFALQRYQEARAQYGHRYTEYLRYLGIRPSDARLQRPEYLGGGKQTVSFSEVLATAGVAGASPVVGDMKGHGIAAMRSNRYRYFCEEHGFIMSLISIRPRTMYVTGKSKVWDRRTKEDYFQKELEQVGQQEVFKREIFSDGSATDDDVFGYQDRYSEYRHQQSIVTGDFRDTLNHWHLGRDFTAHPTLNESFVTADPSDRIFAVEDVDQMLSMVSHSVQVRRMVGTKTIGRII